MYLIGSHKLENTSMCHSSLHLRSTFKDEAAVVFIHKFYIEISVDEDQSILFDSV